MKKIKKFLLNNYSFLIEILVFICVNYLVLGKLQFDFSNKFAINNSKFILLIVVLIEILLFSLVYYMSKKKYSIEKKFLFLIIPISMLYLFFVPLGRVPDEKNHFLRAYEISEGYLISDRSSIDKSGGREFSNKIDDAFNFKNSHMRYSDLSKNSNLEIKNKDKKKFYIFANMSLYSFICYIPQVIGIIFGKIFNLPIVYIAYLGRLTNLISWIILMYLSLRLIPIKKLSMLSFLFMPMMLQEAASLSADALTNGIAFLLISYTLYLKYNDDISKINKKHFIFLSVLSIFMSLCKIVYLPICLMLFVIPNKKFDSTKKKIISISLLALLVVLINLFWLKFSASYLKEFNPGVNSSKQLMYILNNPRSYVDILFNTYYNNISLFLFNIIGFSLCYFDTNLSYLFVFMYLFLIVVTLVLDTSDRIRGKNKLLPCFIFFSVIILMATSLYMQWTPVGASIVDGIQGRYFIPLLMLLAIIININNVDTSKIKIKLENQILNFAVFMNIYALMIIFFYHL